MLLDNFEVTLKAGDILIQQAPTTPGSIAARKCAEWRLFSSTRAIRWRDAFYAPPSRR